MGQPHFTTAKYFRAAESDQIAPRGYERPEPIHDRALEMELAERLTERRRLLSDREPAEKNTGLLQNRYTQRQIGARLGTSHVAVCHYEIGISCPKTFAGWQRWARALGGRLTITLELPEVK